jgi:hypothetical protein
MTDDRSCLQGGKRHRVDERELQEAREDGGSVACLDCGKSIEQGPRNLEFRAGVQGR